MTGDGFRSPSREFDGGGWQRVGVLTELPPLLEEFGVDPTALLAAVGLPPDALRDPENSLPFLAMGQLIGACVEATKCSHFGLALGQRTGASGLGLVGRLMENAPTLGTALLDLVTNQHRYVRGASPYLQRLGEVFLLGYAIYEPMVQGFEQISDGAVAIGCNIVRELTGLQPTEVMLSRSVPDDCGPYRRFFGAPVRFDAEQSALVYPVSYLAASVRGADAELRAELEKRVQAYWAVSMPDFSSQVMRALRTRCMLGSPSLSSVARLMSLTPRTLNRRLREEGTTFRDVLSEARFELARQLLEGTSMDVTAIGAAFGYADTSVLTRAFHRWSGLTPTEWRERSRRTRVSPPPARQPGNSPASF